MVTIMSDRWKFTVNTPYTSEMPDYDFAPEREAFDWRPVWNAEEMEVLVWQWERGHEEGRLHIEGYVRFKGRKRMSTVKTLMRRNDMHLEKCRGTEQECYDYCTKEDTRVEEGEVHGEIVPAAGQQGRRTDLEEATTAIREGTSMRDVAMAHPSTFVRYQMGLFAFQQIVQPAPAAQRDVLVTVLWGSTGTGKTHRVMTTYPDIYTVTPGRGPWDGYSGQARILLDEFLDTQWPVTEMNRILDKWRYELNCRYRNKFAAWTEVFICTNQPPMSWYPNEPQPILSALRRRISGRCFQMMNQQQDLATTQADPLP